jgi:hypothetical protein
MMMIMVLGGGPQFSRAEQLQGPPGYPEYVALPLVARSLPST